MSHLNHCIDDTLPAADEYKAAWYARIGREKASGMSLSIRIHRACSWLRRAQETARMHPEDSQDEQVILLWIAFNALYGVWDEEENHPARDIQSVRAFLRAILELDDSHTVETLLQRERALAERLFDNIYLDHYFWRGLNEGEGDDETWQNMPQKGRQYLDAGRTELALDRLLLFRVYQIRCQLVHGGATHGSKLNRQSIADCGRLLHLVLDSMLNIIIEHSDSLKDSLGPICYPPVSDT